MNLSDRVAALIAERENMNNGIDLCVDELKNTNIPLEERWKAYTDLVKHDILIRNEIYGDGFIDELGDNLTLYDDFYVEKYQTESFIDMYEHIIEEDYNEELMAARENLTAWQEKVLASGYSSFTYDW